MFQFLQVVDCFIVVQYIGKDIIDCGQARNISLIATHFTSDTTKVDHFDGCHVRIGTTLIVDVTFIYQQ
jgi:hypothetical protein